MSVLLSLLTLVPGHMGGSETYARELVRELAGRDLEVSTLVAPIAEGFSDGVPERVARDYRGGRSSPQRALALALGTVQRARFRRYLTGVTVVHFPLTVPVPLPAAEQRSVISLLDVQHHDLPALFTRAERVYRTFAYDRVPRRADAVITLSEFAKRRIVDVLEIPSDRVHVAHLGVRPDEFQPKLAGRGTFLLYPAKGWPHKNHATLFEGFRLLRQRRPGLELVLTGATAAELPRLPPGVHVQGLVSRAQLVHLYATAAALVFPSRYEGFGLPVIEAMSSGCPVAAANAGALPEIVGEAGVLFEATDAEDLARAVTEALDRTGELQQLGMARARSYTWAACADVHESLYRQLGAT